MVGTRRSRSAAAVMAILGVAGIAHFGRPQFFDPIVPRWMPGSARTTTYISGLVELSTAVLVALPSTRRIGGWLAVVTFVGVFPANLQAALDGGMHDLDPPLDTAAVAWLRLPLQLPLIWLAWQVARRRTRTT